MITQGLALESTQAKKKKRKPNNQKTSVQAEETLDSSSAVLSTHKK